MIVGNLARRGSAWLTDQRVQSPVISSRVRLARNLAGEKFPDWAEESDRRKIRELLVSAVLATGILEDPEVVDIADASEADLQVLVERRLITPELASRGPGAGLVLSADETVSVMINEEDHLRIQVIQPGLDLMAVWDRANALDSALESRLEYAFSSSLGFLTACPSNLGTGLRASVMLHLLGLRLANDLDSCLKALERLNLAVRGVCGEGSDASGHMFQVSNQETLGRDETSIIGDLSRIVLELKKQEENARMRLMEKTPQVVVDCAARALAVLRNARILPSEEAQDLLSALRLGVEAKVVAGLTSAEINSLLLLSQPGHLQNILRAVMLPEERDQVRAREVGRGLAAAEIIDKVEI